MPTDDAYGWGIQRPNSAGGPPFLLHYLFMRKREAVDHMLCIYGDHPNRKAALKRLTREGIFVVRVRLTRAFEKQAGRDD